MTYRIKITKTRGKEYASIVKNIYDKRLRGSTSRTVQSYGDLVKLRRLNPNIDNELHEKVLRLNNNEKIVSAVDGCNQNTELTFANSIKQVNFGITFYRKVWDRLELSSLMDQIRRNCNLRFDLDLVCFLLAEQRILRPQSVLDTFQNRDNLIFDFSKMTLENLYRCIDVLSMHKQVVIDHLDKFSRKIVPETRSAILFDTENLSFQPTVRNRGVESANNLHADLTALGLCVDKNGIALDYKPMFITPDEDFTICRALDHFSRPDSHPAAVSAILFRLWTEKSAEVCAMRSDGHAAYLKKLLSDPYSCDEVFIYDDFTGRLSSKSVLPENISEFRRPFVVFWSSRQQCNDLKILNRILQRDIKRNSLTKKSCDALSIHQPSDLFNSYFYKQDVMHAGFCLIFHPESFNAALELYKKYLHWQQFRVKIEELDSDDFVDSSHRDQRQLKGNLLISQLAMVLESIGSYLVHLSNLDLPNQQIIDLLSNASLWIVQQREPRKTFYMRQEISADKRKNEQYKKLTDGLLSAVDIKPLNRIEDASGLELKTNLKKRIKFST